jgi:hypothetical protein
MGFRDRARLDKLEGLQRVSENLLLFCVSLGLAQDLMDSGLQGKVTRLRVSYSLHRCLV